VNRETFEERHRVVLEEYHRRYELPYGRMVLLCFGVSTGNLRRLRDCLGIRARVWHPYSRGGVITNLVRFRRPEGMEGKCYDIVRSLLSRFDDGDVCPYCGVRDVLLIHHWYGVDGNYHDKYICPRCNALLAEGKCALVVDGHVMPDEGVQREYIQRRREILRTYWTEQLDGISYEEVCENRARSRRLLDDWAHGEVNAIARKHEYA